MTTQTTSHYVPMRDGVRLAVDVHLPANRTGALPALIRQTRYFRSLDPTWLGDRLGELRVDPVNAKMRRFFVEHGYAWIDVDVRGSGASTGIWHSPWSPLEVADGAEIVDWVVAQPWSNGRVGTTGNSYDGTAAELLATTGHPALRACAPRCSLYDVYTDIAYPGGVRQSWFTASWTSSNQALDANHPEVMVANAIAQARPWLAAGPQRRALERMLRLVFRRVRTVGGDHAAVERALAERAANLDVEAASRNVQFRDDPQPSLLGPRTVDTFSPSAYLDRAKAAAIPTLSISGWFDGAYPHAAIKRHLSVGGARNQLVLGPWNHGVSMNVSPHATERGPGFDLCGELLRFFDHHLRDRETSSPAVRYYVMGAEAWRSSAAWPPPSTPRRFHLDRDRVLSPAPADAPLDVVTHDPDTGTGWRSRWRTLVSPFVVADYPDRATRGKWLVVYRSPPLVEPLEIAGHPLVELFVTTDRPDGAIFAYLEEETERAVHYVTEGMLRLLHHQTDGTRALYTSPAPYRSFMRSDARGVAPGQLTRVVFDLLPVAYRFGRGSRIRLALATADADHFAPVPDAAKSIAIARTAKHPSALVLPVTGGAAA